MAKKGVEPGRRKCIQLLKKNGIFGIFKKQNRDSKGQWLYGKAGRNKPGIKAPPERCRYLGA